MPMKHGERGQTIVEMVFFLPVVLIVLFGVLYVSQYGVVSERAQLSVRYGGVTAATSSAALYSAAILYTTVNAATPVAPPCPTPPPAILSDAAPLPGPSSDPYWRPTTANGSCQLAAVRLGGANFLAAHYFATSTVSMNATLDAANRFTYLQQALNLPSSIGTSASESFVHPADPYTILQCSQEVRKRVNASINIGTATVATPAPSPTPLTFNC